MSTPTDNVNNTGNFVRVKWKTQIREVLFSASVAAEEGGLVYPNWSAAGQYTVADATAGGWALAQTHEWTYIDLTDYVTANEAASSKDVILVTKYISATKGIGILAGAGLQWMNATT